MPLSLILVVTIALLLGGVEFGSWLARRPSTGIKEEQQAPLGSLVTAVLGLLAFILAFTFGMTNSRFEQRRQLVLDEANAIQATYLTASLIPPRARNEIRQLLSEYLETRLNISLQNIRKRLARSIEIHTLLWAQAEALMTQKMDTDIRAAMVGNITHLINLHQSRKTVGLEYRIPGEIWLSLYFLAFVSMVAIGYQVGASGTKRLRGMPVLGIAIALVITMIADIDRPAEGQFKVSDHTFLDVKEMISKYPVEPLLGKN